MRALIASGFGDARLRVRTPVVPLLVALSLALSPGPVGAQPSCTSCHSTHFEGRLRAPVGAARHDVHGAAGIVCVDCHGGDPDATDARAHDLGRGFRGVPDATGTTILCGSCHDGTRSDAPDVLDAFREGAHARATANGRAHAASCTSCHGAHGVQRVAGAEAPTARGHVATLCSGCHSDAVVMQASGLPTDQHAQWLRSVHGRAVQGGNPDAPVCSSCHDPHRTGAGLDATAACGGCHQEVRAAFDRGPHGAAFTRLGFVDCAECHGSHEVRTPDARLLTGVGAACARCHGPGPAIFEHVSRITALAGRIDAVRASMPRSDPRRAAVTAAVHALDLAALEEALAGVPDAEPARRSPEADTAARAAAAAWDGFALPIAVAVVTVVLAVLVFLALRRRSR